MDGIVQERGAVSVLLAEVADRLEADLDLLVNRVEDSVLARVRSTGLVPSGALQDALWKGVMVGVRDALERLRSDGELPDELPPDLIQLAHLCRIQACQQPDLAEVWFVGLEVFWDRFDAMTERLLHDSALCSDVVNAAREQLSAHAARMFELFRCVYEDGVEETAGPNGSSLFEAVSRALQGLWVDPGELGYDLADSHIALVADSSSLLVALSDHAGRPVLLVQTPTDGVWGWLGGWPQLSDRELDELVAWQRSHEGRVAFGEPAEGIAGFSASHYQALEARSLASATGQNVVRFADVRLLIAVLRDSQLAKGLIERELGELDEPGERMAELRATLRVYLEQGQSVSATAALRRRDRKTIQRQLRAAEQLIHHYVRDRSDELLVALRASEILRHRTPVTNGAGSRL
jgi:hypothetical protein